MKRNKTKLKSYLEGITILSCLSLLSCNTTIHTPEPSPHDLVFDHLATTWDEGIPLGNGTLGALVWQKDENLRISLDRADLWDLRPMTNIYREGFTYQWVYEQWLTDQYDTVQRMFDQPYNRSAGPSKIPAGAIEIPISEWGHLQNVRLYTHNGICRITWDSGISMTLFIDAEGDSGWFTINNPDTPLEIMLIPPAYYTGEEGESADNVTGQELTRLGYSEGKLKQTSNSWQFTQEGWNGYTYQIYLAWEQSGSEITGCWSISSHYPDQKQTSTADTHVHESLERGYEDSYRSHTLWWENFWKKASISVPDSILEKQWFMEMYKFGSAARQGSPPISLQAIWTADHGRLPPWKGDFHHDLNTQLSYWPAYSGNHLDLEKGFVDWLWSIRETGKKYTKWFYEVDGLNIPGVSTLRGEPMGGWIQYSLGPTVSAWLGHHFYLHWRYSMDNDFLRERAYPWFKEVAHFLDQIAVRDENGLRKLPISSSPEIYNNSREAWFGQTTNFDLSLIRFTYEKAGEMATILGLSDDAERWEQILSEWPEFTIDESGLLFAPEFPYNEPHRHFSHLMAFHPLGLIDWANGKSDQEIIERTLRNLENIGTDWWVGYSFSWLGNLYARAFEGDHAADILRTFATCFTLPNSFHVNGDQSGTGKSKFTYRPFTLEGNFAFASGIQEMLIQSHTGVVRLFPAIPDEWKDLSFSGLRAEGAFVISAIMEEGEVKEVKIHSEAGEEFRLANPFNEDMFLINGKAPVSEFIKGEIITLQTNPGEKIILMAIE